MSASNSYLWRPLKNENQHNIKEQAPIGLAILGATGSIGLQALEVVAQYPQYFRVEVLSAHAQVEKLLPLIQKYKPAVVVVTDEQAYQQVKAATSASKILFGQAGLAEAVSLPQVHTVLGAIVGFAGLHSTLAAIKAGKKIALANKESLVVAGELVMPMAQEYGAQILPVDSEHSAIFQCLQGEEHNPIEKVVLTASGGPFFGRKPNFLVNVKKEHALQHPNWNMGAKITIDSATLMNKGLEMIEAKWLFGLENSQIEVVIHAQSIIHSLVMFQDGSIKAQMGLPDMKLPIQYALSYPRRLPNSFKRFAFKEYPSFSFEEPDIKTFRNLALAIDAMHKGGNAPCVLNAANEMVVQSFLNNRVGFMEMCDIIEETIQKVPHLTKPTIAQLEESDFQAREVTTGLIKKGQLSH